MQPCLQQRAPSLYMSLPRSSSPLLPHTKSSLTLSRMFHLWSLIQHVLFLQSRPKSMDAGTGVWSLSLCLGLCFVSWMWTGQAAGMMWGCPRGLHIGAVRFQTTPLHLGCTVEGAGRTTAVGWRPEQLVSMMEGSPERLQMDRASRRAAVEPEA